MTTNFGLKRTDLNMFVELFLFLRLNEALLRAESVLVITCL